jgi:hypothetical protein
VEPHDPNAALNQVLSEVIDVVQDVKQAYRKVPATHELHRVLDRLFDDLRTWVGLLMDQDLALGVSPLAMMPSVAGRTPPNLWPGAADDAEVRRIVGEHLDRLGQLLANALATQDDQTSRSILEAIQRELSAVERALSQSVTVDPTT